MSGALAPLVCAGVWSDTKSVRTTAMKIKRRTGHLRLESLPTAERYAAKRMAAISVRAKRPGVAGDLLRLVGEDLWLLEDQFDSELERARIVCARDLSEVAICETAIHRVELGVVEAVVALRPELQPRALM